MISPSINKYKKDVIVLPKDKLQLLDDISKSAFSDPNEFFNKTGLLGTFNGTPIIIVEEECKDDNQYRK